MIYYLGSVSLSFLSSLFLYTTVLALATFGCSGIFLPPKVAEIRDGDSILTLSDPLKVLVSPGFFFNGW